jgi:hypothetical protein
MTSAGWKPVLRCLLIRMYLEASSECVKVQYGGEVIEDRIPERLPSEKHLGAVECVWLVPT